MHIYAYLCIFKKIQIAQCTSGLWGNLIWGLFLVHRFIPGRRVERKNLERVESRERAITASFSAAIWLANSKTKENDGLQEISFPPSFSPIT